mgnify:CR=1 FL=1
MRAEAAADEPCFDATRTDTGSSRSWTIDHETLEDLVVRPLVYYLLARLIPRYFDGERERERDVLGARERT